MNASHLVLDVVKFAMFRVNCVQVTVWYGSQTGTAMCFAEDLGEDLGRAGFSAQVCAHTRARASGTMYMYVYASPLFGSMHMRGMLVGHMYMMVSQHRYILRAPLIAHSRRCV